MSLEECLDTRIYVTLEVPAPDSGAGTLRVTYIRINILTVSGSRNEGLHWHCVYDVNVTLSRSYHIGISVKCYE